ncbi:MAG: transglutaminase domain-containing protein [Nocardioides sp.]|nr:transglutaminase domain-containing protein [Nocardioides sp.]
MAALTRSRGSLSSSALLAAVAATTTLVAVYAWRGFTQAPGGFLNPLLLLGIVVAATGTATRWWRWPGSAVVAAQVVVSGLVAGMLITGSLVPGTGTLGDVRSAIAAALDSSREFAAPVPASAPPIDPLLILCGLACLLLVDLLACTLRRVPLAGLPLLTIYTIPVSLIETSIAWWVFVGTAAGFLAMLFLQEAEHVSRWGRPIAEDRETGDPISLGAGAHAVRRTATGIGGAATALAMVLPLLVPTLGLHVFDFGPGKGDGDNIRIENPVADLVRDLKRGEDTDLVRITTTETNPAYLRILDLNRFTDVEWTPGDRDVPTNHGADGALPPPQGVDAEVTRDEVPYDVTILPAFESRWLPTQFPASNVQAEGDWRYDSTTMDFLAVPGDLTTADLHYTMSALDLVLSPKRLRAAGSSVGQVSEIFTDLPPNLPLVVRQLAVQVTQDQTTRFDKAVALQNWFRSEFTYSLETHASGNGYDALTTFLGDGPDGRVGYCEQFASAMAVMARVLGIPARVAVGFLTPEPDGPNTWVYSSHDMHTWPELFFRGSGWVRFEPTPADRATGVPSYTVSGLPGGLDPSDPAATQSSTSIPGPSNRATQTADPTADTGQNGEADAGLAWGPVLGGGAGLLVVAGLLLLPRLVRRRRRARRLAVAGPEEIWAELHDTALDLGVPWPAGRSPRATRDVLVDHLGLPVDATSAERPAHGADIAPEGAAALDRIVLDVERLRYSRSPADADRSRLRADGRTCIASLTGGAPRAARRRATWWPRSVLAFVNRAPRAVAPTVEARYGGVVDHAN